MTQARDGAVDGVTVRAASQLLHALEELVAALDRRIPQIDRVGEADIAADAAALRASAIHRLLILRQQMHVAAEAGVDAAATIESTVM